MSIVAKRDERVTLYNLSKIEQIHTVIIAYIFQ